MLWLILRKYREPLALASPEMQNILEYAGTHSIGNYIGNSIGNYIGNSIQIINCIDVYGNSLILVI